MKHTHIKYLYTRTWIHVKHIKVEYQNCDLINANTFLGLMFLFLLYQLLLRLKKTKQNNQKTKKNSFH